MSLCLAIVSCFQKQSGTSIHKHYEKRASQQLRLDATAEVSKQSLTEVSATFKEHAWQYTISVSPSPLSLEQSSSLLRSDNSPEVFWFDACSW